MFNYLLRRVLYAIPIMLGVNILTFLLFFTVNSPDDMARMRLGNKHVMQADIDRWKMQYGYDLPLFYNNNAAGVEKVTQTIFCQKSLRLFMLDFGVSDEGRDISYEISTRMWPSLALAIPVLIIGMLVNITFAMLLAFFRSTYFDIVGVALCVILMSISGLFYIIAGQYFIGKILRLVPISGFGTGLNALKFVILPVIIGILGGIGAGVRWYRTLFLEELHKDYVRTARAKGMSEFGVLFKHVLKNALIPILTGVVVIIPSLFLGSLLMESFFSIPGLGSYTIDAIQQQDFAIIRAMVFLGTMLYIVGLILTDLSYTLVDPRVRLE